MIGKASQNVCRELKELLRTDPDFLSKVIIGDERYVYGWNRETRQKSSKWKSPSSTKEACEEQSNIESLLIYLHDADGKLPKFVTSG